jgi:hypothetical protein
MGFTVSDALDPAGTALGLRGGVAVGYGVESANGAFDGV